MSMHVPEKFYRDIHSSIINNNPQSRNNCNIYQLMSRQTKCRVSFYSATTRSKMLTYSTTWETSKTFSVKEAMKTTCCMIPSIGSVQSRQIHNDRKWMRGVRVWGPGAREWLELLCGAVKTLGFASAGDTLWTHPSDGITHFTRLVFTVQELHLKAVILKHLIGWAKFSGNSRKPTPVCLHWRGGRILHRNGAVMCVCVWGGVAGRKPQKPREGD